MGSNSSSGRCPICGNYHFSSNESAQLEKLHQIAQKLKEHFIPTLKKVERRSAAVQLIKEGEGYEGNVYTDTRGFKTIGYGHKILPGQKFTYLSKQQAEELLAKDMEKAERQITNYFGQQTLEAMGQQRAAVLIDMAFNMGSVRWPKLTQAIKNGNYEEASKQIMNSNYANQVGARAKRNALIMATGTMKSKADVKK